MSKEISNHNLYQRAIKVIPGGVNSPVRSFNSVNGDPYFVKKAEGAFVTDVDDNTYLDYVQSYGAIILGHAHPAPLAAVQEAVVNGSTYGAPTLQEVLLAEEIVERVPGCEMIRLTSSGTEAAMTAIRLARGFTNREKIVKFSGCYHGHSDSLLAEGGSGVATLGVVGSLGVTKGSVADTLVVPYNQVPVLDETVAAVIVEPVAANMGLVPPIEGFLEGLRKACDEVGALLIFDEVITGFRISKSGASGWSGITPDLWCFGKVIGGGLPMGAVGGKAQIMSDLAPTGSVYQAGTLSGNPLATAAGLAVLKYLDDDVYHSLAQKTLYLAQGLEQAAFDAGIEIQVNRVESLMSIFFSDQKIINYDQVKVCANNGKYTKFFWSMLRQGISFAPGPYETVFVTVAHQEQDLDRTIQASKIAFSQIS